MKKHLGQFYTKNAKYITQGLLDIFPQSAIIVDMFAGEFDLLKLVENTHQIEAYDIDPKNINTKKQDTLLLPLDYTNKWILTNPPYCARNKNKNKTIYEKYHTDDLYKASLMSIIGCEGGIVVVPLNFLSSEDDLIRTQFLSKYKIKKVNVFEETVFEDTTYTICCFSFYKCDNEDQNLTIKFYPSCDTMQFNIKKSEGYRIGYEVYHLPKSSIKIGRLLSDEALKVRADKAIQTNKLKQKKRLKSSKLFLYAIDTGLPEGVIRLTLKYDLFFGKETDRAFATICFDRDLSIEIQQQIVKKFNEKLDVFRNKYRSLFLTNYRCSTDYMSRKRIGFDLAYTIISNVILEIDPV